MELEQAFRLMKEGMINEALQIVLDLEKKSDLTAQDLLSAKLLKTKLYHRSLLYSKSLKYTKQILDESKEQENLLYYLDGLLIQAYSFIMLGDFSQGNTKLKQADKVFEDLKGVSKIELREKESLLVRIRAVIAALSGNPHLSLELNERALELAKGSDDKQLIAGPLLNLAEDYHALGEYDKAITYAKRSIEVLYHPWLLTSYGVLIEILLGKGDIDNAKFYFQQMSLIKEKYKSKYDNIIYDYYNALILKTSLRARDRIKSEDIFKQISKEKEYFQFMVKSLINLCGLLLIELGITNDTDIINEIKQYITTLLDFTEDQKAYFYAAETYLLQAKLYLLTFDIKKAKRFLTQAQRIAERFDLTQLATKIAKENDDLLKKEDLWIKLKEEGTPMAERLELARLEEQIEGMVRNPFIAAAYISEEKVAISKETKICLVCRGEVLRFTYICGCGAIYCENCARALTNLENVCWLCNVPIDFSKPVKSFEKEEVEGINVNNKGKK
jgi:hypothetical protein